MKTFNSLVICLLAIILSSCQEDAFDPGLLTGSLHIDVGLFLFVDQEQSRLKSAEDTDSFKVIIFRADGSAVISYECFSEMPDSIELEIGDYYAEAHSDNDLPAEFGNPYYFGASDVFTINSNAGLTVQVICELANTIVSVAYSENITGSFTDYRTTVSSALGSLVFLKDEVRPGYFQTLPLDILVELTSLNPDGSEEMEILTGQIPDPLANRHYRINVDASVNHGSAGFHVLLDTSAVQVEVIQVRDDSTGWQTGRIGYGDLLVTEVMYNPSALSDTEGEWFEIYNNSGDTINLQNLILGRDDTDRHTITDSIILAPAAYFVFQRTAISTSATDSYFYGSDITLSNTGAVVYVFNEGTETDPGPEIFSVDYGSAGFPDGTGASICLDPGLLNAGDAVLGTSWCTATSAFSTGDLGTPGLVNDACQ